ncbi:MAG TPA: fatty acid desaturase [Candidatus Obscuribacterales bacterium]
MPILPELKNLFNLGTPWQVRARKLTDFEPRLSTRQLLLEVLRPWLLFGIYLGLALNGLWFLAVPVALVTCFSAFIQMHDCVHSALGLSKAAHNLLLTLSAALILKCGHALKATHLKHHGKCLSEDDPEGITATWPLWRVLLAGPGHMLASRLEALRISPRTRWQQGLETLLTVLLLGTAVGLYFGFGSPVGLVYWGVVASVSATIPLWASYIPHRLAEGNPALLITSHTTQDWTPVLNSFTYHQLHHEYPKVPTALLPALARQLKEKQGR